MNKAQLIDCVQKKLGDDVSKLAAERSVDAVLSAIKLGMRTDKEVQLVGFGSFAVSHRAARRGYNPYTKKPMKIRAMKTIRFKAGLDLREIL
ncbi:MAG: HU family DNA-binding protein [Verrucomicrobiota bacterium]|jgi:nucleoid DNA-binding protein|nr:MAG: HU family DNA-binding protein [Verrucomicrobiota bacterium]